MEGLFSRPPCAIPWSNANYHLMPPTIVLQDARGLDPLLRTGCNIQLSCQWKVFNGANTGTYCSPTPIQRGQYPTPSVKQKRQPNMGYFDPKVLKKPNVTKFNIIISHVVLLHQPLRGY